MPLGSMSVREMSAVFRSNMSSVLILLAFLSFCTEAASPHKKIKAFFQGKWFVDSNDSDEVLHRVYV